MAGARDSAVKIPLDTSSVLKPTSVSTTVTAAIAPVDSGIASWFGPLNPLAPVAPPEVAGRQFDLQPGFNITTRPRQGESVSFSDLRQLADAYDLLRLVIETRKDQIERMPWEIRAKKHSKVPDQVLEAVRQFWLFPDQQHSFSQWLRMILEDLFVLDAPTLWKQRSLDGRLMALHPLDGATIKRVVDNWGRTPTPYLDPDTGELVVPPAYQQVLKGFPAVDYTVFDIMYLPRNVRTNRVYGYSPVEQIIMTVNIALRRQLGQLTYYTDGNIPEALIGVPDAWTPDQIRAFQDYWDLYFTGDLAARRRAKFVPGGVAKTFIATKEPELKNVFDEWLAKICCYAFSVSPQPFVSQVNRATATTQKQTAEEEGLAPILQWIKHTVDTVIQGDFGLPNVEFVWGEDDSLEGTDEATVLNSYVNNGVMTRNEARDRLGMDPSTVPEADELGITTGSGFTFLDQTKNPDPLELAAASRPALPTPGKSGDDKSSDSGKPAPKTAAKPAPKSDGSKSGKKPAKKMASELDLRKAHVGHDVSGEARDARGRFTAGSGGGTRDSTGRFVSTGAPTSRQRRKASNAARRTEDDAPRDEMGHFVAGKLTAKQIRRYAARAGKTAAVGAGIFVAGKVAEHIAKNSSGTKQVWAQGLSKAANKVAKDTTRPLLDQGLALAIRHLFKQDAEIAEKNARTFRRFLFEIIPGFSEQGKGDGDPDE